MIFSFYFYLYFLSLFSHSTFSRCFSLLVILFYFLSSFVTFFLATSSQLSHYSFLTVFLSMFSYYFLSIFNYNFIELKLMHRNNRIRIAILESNSLLLPNIKFEILINSICNPNRPFNKSSFTFHNFLTSS